MPQMELSSRGMGLFQLHCSRRPGLLFGRATPPVACHGRADGVDFAPIPAKATKLEEEALLGDTPPPRYRRRHGIDAIGKISRAC